MKHVWIIARWEFLGTVLRAGFLATVVALPLVHLGLGLLIGHSVSSTRHDPERSKAVVVVDARGVLGETAQQDGDRVVRDEPAAIAALERGETSAVFVLADDYLDTGRLRSYTRLTPGLFSVADNVERRTRASAVIRRALLPSTAERGRIERVVEPAAAVIAFTIDGRGTVARDSGSALVFLSGAFGVSLLLSVAIFMSSGLLQQAMVIERQNRLLEVLLVSVSPLSLLTGKVIGLSAAGLIQVAVYLAFAVTAAPALLGMVDIPMSVLWWSMACFTAGYILFACLMAGAGALGRDTRQSAQIASAWMLAGALPIFFLASIAADGASALARTLTWIPVTAPVALLLRMGAQAVSTGELAGALLMTLAAAVTALLASAALLRRVTIAGAR
jgi:ABC-2 type transport system permease protein